ncbi:lipase 3 [Harpegnathos saltator]|uniref:Lipase n=1 Tax=Harpegnathos saltator TaxID=610380 RepID=E2B370_HARSA|nr:lipase 3 [Harpegnathos saltator]EFN89852.1 Lipase 3 [Harpegnathos saltator]
MRLTAVCLSLLCGFLGVFATLEELPQDLSLEKFMKLLRLDQNSVIADYNTDINLNTPGMIRKQGYPAEAHVIPTEDDYLLTLHRIPGDENSPPVFLQHGLLGSSADWVISGKGKGLAYILADQGYDVWMGNFRGNTYSKAHVTLSPFDSRFWNFSFHEMGIYDLPAAISYVTNMRFQPLHAYIGHSMGTTAFYVMATQCPQITQMIQMMISLAPVAFLQHIKSPVRILAPYSMQYEIIAQFLGETEFLPQTKFLRFLSKYLCNQNIIEQKICANILFMICGFDKEQFNYTLLPSILSHSPAGTSTKTIVHLAQEVKSGKFRPYDYGPKRNQLLYNATEPPDYDFTNVTVPIALFYSDNDWFVSHPDMRRLYRKLNNVIDVYRVPFEKFNHLDFLWGIDAPKLVYKRLLQDINTSYSDK